MTFINLLQKRINHEIERSLKAKTYIPLNIEILF